MILDSGLLFWATMYIWLNGPNYLRKTWRMISASKKDGLDHCKQQGVVIRELLRIKHNFANMTLYTKEEIDFILEYCCTS